MNEFIDAYSDDQIYLEMIEKLVNEHSIEQTVPDRIKYSSFCRLWIVMMVGSIEMLIKTWTEDKVMMADIANYFNDGPNEERIERLFNTLRFRGLPSQKEYFDDFLACKFIRNAYIHGKWNEKQRVYVESRGFPSVLMNFSPQHYIRVKQCYYHIMNQLGMANAANTILEKKLLK